MLFILYYTLTLILIDRGVRDEGETGINISALWNWLDAGAIHQVGGGGGGLEKTQYGMNEGY